jgi:hypothetical protein
MKPLGIVLAGPSAAYWGLRFQNGATLGWSDVAAIAITAIGAYLWQQGTQRVA